VFESLPLYNDVLRSFASLRMTTESSSLAMVGMTRLQEKSDSSSVARRDDNSSRAAPLLGARLTWESVIKITTPLSDVFAPVLERLLNQAHELIGHGAVDDAMIVTER